MSKLLTNTTDLQEVLQTLQTKAAGTALPELTNEGSASDLLSGKQLIDQEGNVVTGTIPTKTSSNLTASGAMVTVPSGYYASEATKGVQTVTRADTTISVSADDTNDKLTITASNNQGTGYVTGANKTASKTISLTTSGATVTASDGTNSISKSVSTATQATPSISIDSAGKITASATQTAGYVSAGTKTGTKQLTTQSAKTVTPSKSSQTAVANGVYTTGAVTVAAIPSEYITTTDATASADDIMNGETAYVNGSKVTGAFTIDDELTAQDDLIAQIQAAVDGLPEANSIDLPKLTNPGESTDLLEGKELIDSNGNVVVGTHVCSGGGSGNSFETVIGTVSESAPLMGDTLNGTVYYIDGSGTYATSNIKGTITVMKGSIIVGYSSDGIRVSGGINQVSEELGNMKVYLVTDDFNIKI